MESPAPIVVAEDTQAVFVKDVMERVSTPNHKKRRNKMTVEFTEAAVKKIKELIEAQNLSGAVLRMGVKGGGCSGLTYSLEFDNEAGPQDKIFEVEGIRAVVDPKSYLYLNGMTLDYVTQGLTGGFVFQNPNAQSTCGCGTSFSPRQ